MDMDVTAVVADEPGVFRLDEEQLQHDGVVFTAYGELDMATVPELRERMGAAIEGGIHRVVIDLRPLDFLDSVAVAAMLHARRQLGDEGRLVVIIDPDSYIRMVFEIAGLPQCLDVVETREAALAAVTA
jgi:anti-sigma B factor antagonist